jgi:hypothetical protein
MEQWLMSLPRWLFLHIFHHNVQCVVCGSCCSTCKLPNRNSAIDKTDEESWIVSNMYTISLPSNPVIKYVYTFLYVLQNCRWRRIRGIVYSVKSSRSNIWFTECGAFLTVSNMNFREMLIFIIFEMHVTSTCIKKPKKSHPSRNVKLVYS